MKKTPIYEQHITLGGKIIDFGGWALPVEYEGILSEHHTVRSAAGIFDVSHMGEIVVKGPDAESFLQYVLTNDISAMADHQVFYSLMCYPDGGVVDDLLVYRHNRNHYLLVVNSSTKDNDFRWLKENSQGLVEIDDVSDNYALLALQGPKAEVILQELTDENLDALKFLRFRPKLEVAGIKTLVSRTGYTGEDGFEIYVDPIHAPLLWGVLLKEGAKHGLKPIGLGARDTLRFEASLPLYGQEISPEITPLEAGLGIFVKLGKEKFIGQEALRVQKENGVPRKLIAFEMVEKGIPRIHYDVLKEGRKIGCVTTGGVAPSLDKNAGLALVEADQAQVGDTIEVAVRKKSLKALVVPKPLYKKKYKK